MKNQLTVKECLDYIEEVKEHYQLGMLFLGKTLEECELERDAEIARVTNIMLKLNQ